MNLESIAALHRMAISVLVLVLAWYGRIDPAFAVTVASLAAGVDLGREALAARGKRADASRSD